MYTTNFKWKQPLFLDFSFLNGQLSNKFIAGNLYIVF